LIVDEMGREVDIHGRVIMIPKHNTTLKINRRAAAANSALLEKEKAAQNPYFDPSTRKKKAEVGNRGVLIGSNRGRT